MKDKTVYQVIIIGAGPAGLALGYYLKEAGIKFIILEKGTQAGESWSKMPDHLHLISLWKSNYLVEKDKKLFPAYQPHSAVEYAKYLSEFSNRNKLPLTLDCKVTSVSGMEGAFTVETNNGQNYLAHLVVDCRGYFSFPWIPAFKNNGKNLIKEVHFNQFQNASLFQSMNSICVVGKRLSAGQVITELLESDPQKKIYVSARSKIRFSPPMWGLSLLLKYLNWIEWLPMQFRVKKSSDIPMHSSVKKYFTKNVEVVGDILEIHEDQVVFPQGIRKVDAIIYATGFKRENVLLRDDFESLAVNGKFYLGINVQRTFTSRFLRGIKADAPVLAKLILGRLASKNSCQ